MNGNKPTLIAYAVKDVSIGTEPVTGVLPHGGMLPEPSFCVR